MADAHLDFEGWEWHYDDTSDATKAILTRVVWVSGSTEVNIPTQLFSGINILTIGSACFYDVEGAKITKVLSMPSTITSIEDYAFSHCASMTLCVISSGVTSIGNNVFANCYVLASLTIPNSVITIGAAAFSYCTALTSLTIGSGVTSIGVFAFSGCNAVSAITVNASNSAYANNAGDGILYNKAITSIIRYPPAKTGTSFTIPSGVTLVAYGAFNSCTSLTSIAIPNSVATIEANAFFGCNALTSTTIPEGVTAIEHSTFEQCHHLASVTFPNSLVSIATDSFWEDDALTSLTIPNNVTIIMEHAFWMCYGLTSVVIGSGLTTVGIGIFGNCTSLNSITFLGLIAPTSVESNWIENTPATIRGHAYAASNFPTPGNSFNGLLMGGNFTDPVYVTIDDGIILTETITHTAEVPAPWSGGLATSQGASKYLLKKWHEDRQKAIIDQSLFTAEELEWLEITNLDPIVSPENDEEWLIDNQPMDPLKQTAGRHDVRKRPEAGG